MKRSREKDKKTPFNRFECSMHLQNKLYIDVFTLILTCLCMCLLHYGSGENRFRFRFEEFSLQKLERKLKHRNKVKILRKSINYLLLMLLWPPLKWTLRKASVAAPGMATISTPQLMNFVNAIEIYLPIASTHIRCIYAKSTRYIFISCLHLLQNRREQQQSACIVSQFIRIASSKCHSGFWCADLNKLFILYILFEA